MLINITKAIGWIALAVVLFIGGKGLWYWSQWHTYSWNQELIVTVSTPQGEASGAAITHYRVNYMEPCRFGGMSQLCVDTSKSGEATIVALPDGQYLFVLLSEEPGQLAKATLREKLPGPLEGDAASTERYYEQLTRYRTPEAVPPRGYPQMVYFEDLNDPLSVREVDPNDLAASFGPGYALASVRLQVTDERIEFGKVEEVLTWIDRYRNTTLDGRRIHTINTPHRLANSLGMGSFTTGE